MNISYDCKGKNNSVYSVQIRQNQNKIDILIQDKNSIKSGKYKISLTLEELCQLNEYFEQYEDIEKVYKNFAEIEKINELTSIEVDTNLLKFHLTLPNIPKSYLSDCLELMMKSDEIGENEILFNLCKKVKEIDELKKEKEYLYFLLEKTEKDFENLKRIKELFSELTGGSKIIKFDDLAVVQKGIYKNSNKIIKNIRLLYKASKNGDSGNAFHSKCDNERNTVTFVKAKNGRRFGGFTEKGWNSDGRWFIDLNTFLFSLDTKECYFYKEGSCMYGGSYYGPEWGGGSDLYLDDNCLSSNNNCSRESINFEYYGKKDCLSGGEHFQIEDYETYQLVLE